MRTCVWRGSTWLIPDVERTTPPGLWFWRWSFISFFFFMRFSRLFQLLIESSAEKRAVVSWHNQYFGSGFSFMVSRLSTSNQLYKNDEKIFAKRRIERMLGEVFHSRNFAVSHYTLIDDLNGSQKYRISAHFCCSPRWEKLRTKHQGQSIDVCKGINLTERQ